MFPVYIRERGRDIERKIERKKERACVCGCVGLTQMREEAEEGVVFDDESFVHIYNKDTFERYIHACGYVMELNEDL